MMFYTLITGAAGHGKAIAEELAARPYNLILVGRTMDELCEISKGLEKKYGAC